MKLRVKRWPRTAKPQQPAVARPAPPAIVPEPPRPLRAEDVTLPPANDRDALTPPLLGFLNRDRAKVRAAPVLALATPLLQELVNYGSHVLVTCHGSGGLAKDEGWAPLRLYYRIIEMTDGIEVALREGCVYPAVPALRSSYEATLHLDFILGHPNVHEASLAWLAGQVKRRILELHRKNPTGKASKPHLGEPWIAALLAEQIREHTARDKRVLAEPHMRAIAAKVDDDHPDRWFARFGGGNNLWQLSQKLDERAADPEASQTYTNGYRFLFSHYSVITHGGDFDRFIRNDEPGTITLEPIRDTRELAQVAHMAAGMMIQSTRLLVRWLRPDLDALLRQWYVTKVQRRWMALGEFARARNAQIRERLRKTDPSL